MKNLAQILTHLGFKLDDDFEVSDKLDGNGPFISEWKSSKSKPTDKQLKQAAEEVEILNAKKSKSAQLKTYTKNKIESIYPIYKQLNITNLSGYTEQERQEMIDYIKQQRDYHNQKEEEINNAQTLIDVESISIE